MYAKGGSTYIITNRPNTVLYTGVTSDLIIRIPQHIYKIRPFAFTAKYNCDKLVYYECFESIEAAIKREKQIKGWVRNKKITLIESVNPKWEDLFEKDVKLW
ncbi:MAG: GIY-YIG nuclease family protein [Fimbriimonadaceae bacterium]|nr:GIY-YIG nuclease family protein [Chitinophagales bacterium]